MKVNKKFTALQLSEHEVNRTVKAKLEFGTISGPYYNEIYPETTFDTEEDAINWAYKESPYSTWIILPVISFIN